MATTTRSHALDKGPRSERYGRWGGGLRAVFSVRALREMVLTVGALAGVFCLVAAFAAVAFDVKPVVFRSGSMSPAIDTGALAISRTTAASHLAVGDVVTVRTQTGVRVTHRITAIAVSRGAATLVLKGDANNVPDEQTYVVRSAPRVLFSVPKAGYALSYASGPTGVFAGGLLVGFVVLTLLRPSVRRPKNRSGPGGSRKALVAVGIVAVGLATTVVVTPGSSTQAYYSDAATATSGVFTASATPTQADAPCTYDHGILTIRIHPVTGATGYTITLLKGSVATTINVGANGIGTIDPSLLSSGIYAISAVAIGVGGGVGVSLGTFTVVNVLGSVTIPVLLCLDVDLHLGTALRPPIGSLSAGSTPSANPTTPPADDSSGSTDAPTTSAPTTDPDPAPSDPAPSDPAPSDQPAANPAETSP